MFGLHKFCVILPIGCNDRPLGLDALNRQIKEMTNKRNIAVLGSTGSIGKQTLDIITEYPDLFEVGLLVARSSADLLISAADSAQTGEPFVITVTPTEGSFVDYRLQIYELNTWDDETAAYYTIYLVVLLYFKYF